MGLRHPRSRAARGRSRSGRERAEWRVRASPVDVLERTL